MKRLDWINKYKMKNFTPLQINNFAELFSSYQIFQGVLENWLEENIVQFCKFSHDYYDNSLEIYLGPHWDNVKLDNDIIEKIQEFGFGMCYVNYCNSKEEVIYFQKGKIHRGDIKLVEFSKWTVEEAAEYINLE